MRSDLGNLLHQETYKRYRRETAEWLKASLKKSMGEAEFTRISEFRGELSQAEYDGSSGGIFMGHPSLRNDHFVDIYRKAVEQEPIRKSLAKRAIAEMWKGIHMPQMVKAGVTTALGYNFYDLRGPVSLLYPVNTWFRNNIARVGRVNDGYGTAAHWMATKNPGFVYAGVSEGNRNAAGTPDNNQYLASYKEIGGERQASFTSEFAGEGFADNVADEHIRGLHSLFLQEEGMILCGNSGTGGLGFALGTPAAPTIVRTTDTSGGFSGSTSVSVAVVYLTAMGNPVNVQYGYVAPLTVAGGLTPSYRRTNADDSVDTINGGCSAISPMSSVVTCDATHQKATATVPAGTKGVYGYAWYVNTTDSSTPSLANARLYAITTVPTVTITAAASASAQAGNATGLDSDHSFNALDFDGLLTIAASTSGAYYKDLGGVTLTSGKDGSVVEIDTALQSIFDNYQAGVDAIWGSSDAITCLDKAIRYSGTNAAGYQFVTQRDGQNNLLGGYVVSAYQSRYAFANPTGANAIPIRIHPMLPKGTLYFDINTNPYPQSRAPFVRSMLVQRDYYSIEWPVVSRSWTFGTYAHEVLAHYMPWIPGLITGVSSFVGN